MTSNQELLEMDILKFFKQSLIKYIHIDQHLGFQKHFMENASYSPEQVQAALSNLVSTQHINRHGNLLSLTDKGSDKSCEGLGKKS
ncbi:MAG: hypothetical protein Q7V63_02010 [Gammaproteobacteria bacterium]|nr:hypothetical protein [Gammaproteobacteria bacterium]